MRVNKKDNIIANLMVGISLWAILANWLLKLTNASDSRIVCILFPVICFPFVKNKR